MNLGKTVASRIPEAANAHILNQLALHPPELKHNQNMDRFIMAVTTIFLFVLTNRLKDEDGYAPVSGALKLMLLPVQYYNVTEYLVRIGVFGRQQMQSSYKGKKKTVYFKLPRNGHQGKCKSYKIVDETFLSGPTVKTTVFSKSTIKGGKHYIPEFAKDMEVYHRNLDPSLFKKSGPNDPINLLRESLIADGVRKFVISGRPHAMKREGKSDDDIEAAARSHAEANLEIQLLKCNSIGGRPIRVHRCSVNGRLFNEYVGIKGTLLDMMFAGRDLKTIDLFNSQPTLIMALIQDTEKIMALIPELRNTIQKHYPALLEYRNSAEFQKYKAACLSGTMYEGKKGSKMSKVSVFEALYGRLDHNGDSKPGGENSLASKYPDLCRLIGTIKRNSIEMVFDSSGNDVLLNHIINESSRKSKYHGSRKSLDKYRAAQRDGTATREMKFSGPYKGKDIGCALFPILMQHIESKLFIDKIYKPLIEEGIGPLLTKHDSITCFHHQYDRVVEKVKEVFEEFVGGGKFRIIDHSEDAEWLYLFAGHKADHKATELIINKQPVLVM